MPINEEFERRFNWLIGGCGESVDCCGAGCGIDDEDV